MNGMSFELEYFCEIEFIFKANLIMNYRVSLVMEKTRGRKSFDNVPLYIHKSCLIL
jgi:hypothetical protein